jgi:hypothetical protein
VTTGGIEPLSLSRSDIGLDPAAYVLDVYCGGSILNMLNLFSQATSDNDASSNYRIFGKPGDHAAH